MVLLLQFIDLDTILADAVTLTAQVARLGSDIDSARLYIIWCVASWACDCVLVRMTWGVVVYLRIIDHGYRCHIATRSSVAASIFQIEAVHWERKAFAANKVRCGRCTGASNGTSSIVERAGC